MKLNELISVINECNNYMQFILNNKVVYQGSEEWDYIYNHSELYDVKSIDITVDYIINIEVE